MENRIDKLFAAKKRNILSVFVTGGFPKPESTLPIIEELDRAGVDMIEIGIPFSDPIADGPVIQNSNEVALENGTSLKKLFGELKMLRSLTEMPVLMMGYLNSVLQFGLENFYKTCYNTGIDGLILPDLPLDEYFSDHKALAEKYNIHLVFMISPSTSPERIRLIDQHSRGFIYLVSSNATTGNDNGVKNELDQKVKELNSMNLNNPIIMGFGIKGSKDFGRACSLVNGAIIGSAFISQLTESATIEGVVSDFIRSITTPKNIFQL